MATVPATFRAYRYAEHGDPAAVLQLRSGAPQSSLNASQVRVKVLSAALNPVDPVLVANYAPSLLSSHPSAETPFGIGFDGDGVIVEVGSGVASSSALKVGDSVYFMTSFTSFGTFAEYIAVEQDYVVLKPAGLSFDQAASVPLIGLTSYQALVEHSQLQKGERVLVLGGSSATGLYATQIAKALGAHVVVTASGRNAEFAKSFGADQVVDYTSEKWSDVLEPHSIDVLYDCGMEPRAWDEGAQKVLKKHTGRFVTLLPLAEPTEPQFGAKLIGNIFVHPSAPQLGELSKLIDTGKLATPIDSVHAFENVQDAIAKSKTRRARGKIVIKVTSE